MAIGYVTPHQSLGAHQYAVIDRQIVSDIPESWPVMELILPMLAPQAHLYPWLVPLRELPAGEWEKLMSALSQCSELNPPRMGNLLLTSPCPPQQVRNALIKALYFKDLQLNGHILRFYDPRVLFQLQWMLSPWQLSNVMSIKDITHWTFWLDGNWHTLTGDACPSARPEEMFGIQVEQLAQCGRINQALRQLPIFTELDKRQQISRQLDALLSQAERCGLATEEDCISFALHGLVRPEAFWVLPKMSAFLQQARQNPHFYRNETSQWDDKRWQEMLGN